MAAICILIFLAAPAAAAAKHWIVRATVSCSDCGPDAIVTETGTPGNGKKLIATRRECERVRRVVINAAKKHGLTVKAVCILR